MLQLRRKGIGLARVLGRGGAGGMQQGVQSLGNRSIGLLRDGSNHRGESRKRVGATFGFRTLRNFTRDHRGPERPFRSIVGGLNGRVAEESQYMASVMLQADAIQQTLVIGIAEQPRAQLMGQLVFHLLPLLPESFLA